MIEETHSLTHRDPERIDRMIERLQELWHTNPDWQLGQLLVQIIGHTDPFGVEDGDMESMLNDPPWPCHRPPGRRTTEERER